MLQYLKRSTATVFFILAGVSLSAQFNDSTHHYIKYTAAGIINKTDDVSSFIVNNALSFSVHKKKIDFNNSNTWVYGQQNRALINNDFSSLLNLDLLRSQQRLYYWGLVTYTTSFSLKINHQFQAGAGVGYTFFDRQGAWLVLSDGLLYETSDLLDAKLGPIHYQTVRNSLRVKYRFQFGNTVTLEGANYWQPSLSSFRDYIVQSVTSLSVRLRKWLSITSSLSYNRYSRTDRENLLVNFGLIAEHYF